MLESMTNVMREYATQLRRSMALAEEAMRMIDVAHAAGIQKGKMMAYVDVLELIRDEYKGLCVAGVGSVEALEALQRLTVALTPGIDACAA